MSSKDFRLSRRDAIRSGVLASVGLALGRPLLGLAADQALPLITKEIPGTGEKLPVVGLGTNAYSVTEPADIAARREVLRRMPELGASVVDTARAYGRSEEVI